MTLDLVLGGAVVVPYVILLTADRYLGWHRRRRARNELAAVPPLGATSAEGTIVRVTGTVRATGATLVAPLSGLECVAFDARATPHVRGPAAVNRTRVRSEIVPFALDRDGEAPVSIDGRSARIDLDPIEPPMPRGWAPAAHRQRMELRDALRERQQQLLHKLALSPIATARFEERVVRSGTRVSVAGVLVLGEPILDGERGFRELGPPSWRLAGDDHHPLIIREPLDDRAP